MQKTVVLSLLIGAVLSFCLAAFFVTRTWRNLTRGRRIAAPLLLAPHFLLVVCILVGVLSGKAPQGSRQWNEAFFADVLMVFILPLPALLGTVMAMLVIFIRPRPRP